MRWILSVCKCCRDSAMGNSHHPGACKPWPRFVTRLAVEELGVWVCCEDELLGLLVKFSCGLRVLEMCITDYSEQVDWVEQPLLRRWDVFTTDQSRFDGFLYAKEQPPMFLETWSGKDESSGTLGSALAELVFLGLEHNPDAGNV